jgi:hypothetical protein
MRNQRKPTPLPPDDDGRTIAPMDGEGMPWHVPPRPRPPRDPNAEPLRGGALFRYMFSAVGAGLLVVLAFSAAGAAFILFCTQIWFR